MDKEQLENQKNKRLRRQYILGLICQRAQEFDRLVIEICAREAGHAAVKFDLFNAAMKKARKREGYGIDDEDFSITHTDMIDITFATGVNLADLFPDRIRLGGLLDWFVWMHGECQKFCNNKAMALNFPAAAAGSASATNAYDQNSTVPNIYDYADCELITPDFAESWLEHRAITQLRSPIDPDIWQPLWFHYEQHGTLEKRDYMCRIVLDGYAAWMQVHKTRRAGVRGVQPLP